MTAVKSPHEYVSVSPLHIALTLPHYISVQTDVYGVGVVYLEGLHECPEKDADGVALPQQLDESSRAEQPQEPHVERIILYQTHQL